MLNTCSRAAGRVNANVPSARHRSDHVDSSPSRTGRSGTANAVGLASVGIWCG